MAIGNYLMHVIDKRSISLVTYELCRCHIFWPRDSHVLYQILILDMDAANSFDFFLTVFAIRFY